MKLLIGSLHFTFVVISFCIDSNSASENKSRPKIPIWRPGFSAPVPQIGSGKNIQQLSERPSRSRDGGTVHHQRGQNATRPPRPPLNIDLNKPPPIDDDEEFERDFQQPGYAPFPIYPPPNYPHPRHPQ